MIKDKEQEEIKLYMPLKITRYIKIIARLPKDTKIYVKVFIGAGGYFSIKGAISTKKLLMIIMHYLQICIYLKGRLRKFLEEIKFSINARDYFNKKLMNNFVQTYSK